MRNQALKGFATARHLCVNPFWYHNSPITAIRQRVLVAFLFPLPSSSNSLTFVEEPILTTIPRFSCFRRH